MKAAYVPGFGPPEAITIGELSRLAPGLTDVLVEVETVAVNRVDAHIRAGRYRTVDPALANQLLELVPSAVDVLWDTSGHHELLRAPGTVPPGGRVLITPSGRAGRWSPAARALRAGTPGGQHNRPQSARRSPAGCPCRRSPRHRPATSARDPVWRQPSNDNARRAEATCDERLTGGGSAKAIGARRVNVA